MAATDSIPLNFGFTGKGNDAGLNGPRGIVEAGAMGLKLHEDWGSTPEAIDRALIIGDEYDIQVSTALQSGGNQADNRSISIRIRSTRVVMLKRPSRRSTIGQFTRMSNKPHAAEADGQIPY